MKPAHWIGILALFGGLHHVSIYRFRVFTRTVDSCGILCHREPLALFQRRGDLLGWDGDCFPSPRSGQAAALAVTKTCFL